LAREVDGHAEVSRAKTEIEIVFGLTRKRRKADQQTFAHLWDACACCRVCERKRKRGKVYRARLREFVLFADGRADM
jgi:hypothetical protein